MGPFFSVDDVGLVAQLLKVQNHLLVLFVHVLDIAICVVDVELHLLDLFLPVCLFYVQFVVSWLLLTHWAIVQPESIHSRLAEPLFSFLLFLCAHEPRCGLSEWSFGVQKIKL